MLLVVIALGCLTSTSAGRDSSDVPLIVWDAIVRPGGPNVISIRTCQPRGISQAEILIRRPAKSLSTVQDTTVFSVEEDVVVLTSQPEDEAILTSFVSPSGSVNTRHGPLLAMTLEPEFDLVPGDVFDLVIDPDSTWQLVAE